MNDFHLLPPMEPVDCHGNRLNLSQYIHHTDYDAEARTLLQQRKRLQRQKVKLLLFMLRCFSIKVSKMETKLAQILHYQKVHNHVLRTICMKQHDTVALVQLNLNM